MRKVILLFALCVMFSLSASAQSDMLLLKTSGKVVIGDTTQISTPGTYNLYVQNGLLTEKVKVALKNSSEWADDAFDKTPSLDLVQQNIDTKKHLVDMPSADFLVTEGYEVTNMDAKLLQQIEWLWQHTIKMNEENKILRQRIEELEKKQ